MSAGAHRPWAETEATDIASAWRSAVRDVVVEEGGALRGTLVAPDALVGPPGRLHGGFHPLVRTIPLLAASSELAALQRIHVDAVIRRGIPLGVPLELSGRLIAGPNGCRLESRVGEGDRLFARAATLPAGPLETLGLDGLPSSGGLDGLRDRLAAARGLDPDDRIVAMGATYRVADELVFIDLGADDAYDSSAHVARCLESDGRVAEAALVTQIDAVGAIARAGLFRHPHFTTRIAFAYDLGVLGHGAPVIVADRRRIEVLSDPSLPPVSVRDMNIESARVEVFAWDAALEHLVARAVMEVHPVDPARFGGFEQMRRLRSR